MKKIPRFFRRLIYVLIVLGLFWTVVNLIKPYQVTDNNLWKKQDMTLISAHRGGAELNPENTKMAFDYVINETNYTDIVEFDVRLTKDDELVIIHDETINRTGINNEQSDVVIRERTYEELKNYNLGVNFEKDGIKPYADISLSSAEKLGLTIMTLEDFFDRYQDSRYFRIFLEIKDKEETGILAVDKVEELLASSKYSMWDSRVMIISFSKDVVKHVVNNYPNRYVAGMGYNMVGSMIGSKLHLDSLFKVKFHSIQTSMKVKVGPFNLNCATKGFVKSAHKRNQSVVYWTINDESDMQKLIDLGADIITTDSPDILAKVLGKK